jgi:MATE family multidrug resistance protein
MPCSYYLGFVRGWEGIGVWTGLVIGLGVASILLSARFWGVVIKDIAKTYSPKAF